VRDTDLIQIQRLQDATPNQASVTDPALNCTLSRSVCWEDGTAMLAYGGYDGVVARVAKQIVKRSALKRTSVPVFVSRIFREPYKWLNRSI
jgi:hypothetical protein